VGRWRLGGAARSGPRRVRWLGYFSYSGPDALTEKLIETLNLPDTTVVIQTRLEPGANTVPF
jgi:hypothetical protein